MISYHYPLTVWTWGKLSNITGHRVGVWGRGGVVMGCWRTAQISWLVYITKINKTILGKGTLLLKETKLIIVILPALMEEWQVTRGRSTNCRTTSHRENQRQGNSILPARNNNATSRDLHGVPPVIANPLRPPA